MERDSLSAALKVEQQRAKQREEVSSATSQTDTEMEVVPLLGSQDANDPATLRARIRELESQLSRAEASTGALQDAAARAAERLQEQAMKERELEQQLAQQGNMSAPQFVQALVGGVSAVNKMMTGATAKCLRRGANDSSSPRGPPPPPPQV